MKHAQSSSPTFIVCSDYEILGFEDFISWPYAELFPGISYPYTKGSLRSILILLFRLIPPSTLSDRNCAIRILLVVSVCPVHFICLF